MRRRARILHLLLLICGLFLSVGKGRQAVASSTFHHLFSGRLQIEGDLAMTLQVTPPIAMPGDQLTLEATLINHSATTASPEVVISLPEGLAPPLDQFSPGTTIHFSTGTVVWTPVLEPSGGGDRLELQLSVVNPSEDPGQSVTALLRHQDSERLVTADFWIGRPPQATVNLQAAQVAIGQPLRLAATVTGPGPFHYRWELGDGRRVEVAEPLVTYPAAGTYLITLYLSNPLTTTTATSRVTVLPRPVADFSLDDETVAVSQLVRFVNSSGGLNPLDFHWEFGDGSSDKAKDPLHIYTQIGTYPVRLVVSNSQGTSEIIKTIHVGQPPSSVDLIVSDMAITGQPIMGQGLSDATADAFEWQMGDGTAYQSGQIEHRYLLPGNYWVSLRALNEFGSLETGKWVQVLAGGAVESFYLPYLIGDLIAPIAPPDTGIAAAVLVERIPMLAPHERYTVERRSFPATISPADQLLSYINDARQQYDLPALSASATLARAAQQHSLDMAENGFTSHMGSDGSTPRQRLGRVGYALGYGGETTYWGLNDPAGAVEFWMNSPPHRRILLSRYVTEVGTAFTADYDAPHVWYWTADFGSSYLPPVEVVSTPTPTPTVTHTPAFMLTQVYSPTLAVTATPSATATPTSGPTSAPLPTYTPLPLVTATPLPTIAPSPSVTATDTPTPTVTHTPGPTSTPLASPTPVNTSTPTPTMTPLPLVTVTHTPTITPTPQSRQP